MFLIRRAGELVTREDIIAEVWKDSAVVDQRSINSAIRKIRKTLCDDSDSPRYIETVVRRGYRFIAPVTVGGTEAVPPSAIPQSTRSAGRQLLNLRAIVVMAGIALALAVGGLAGVLSRQKQQAFPAQLTWKSITKNAHANTRIASDGRNVYWTECNETGCQPWQVPIDGGRGAVRVQVPFLHAAVADAPDNSPLILKGADIQQIYLLSLISP
jgi:hypothetical protein